MATFTRFLPVFACIAALCGIGAAQAQIQKSDYRPIVGLNSASSGFQTGQIPSNLQLAGLGTNFAVKRLDYEVFGDSVGRLKFFLPPGTVAFNANLYYYYAFNEGKVALRLNNPATTPLGSISVAHSGGSINESVLRRLIAGEEILNYSPGAPANSLALSSPDNPIEPMITGGYVYGNYQYPGELLQRGLLQVFVKADCYEQWFNSTSTKWDFNGNPDENATHTCSGSSGGENPPPPALESVTVSPSTARLQVGTAQALTLLPVPSSVPLPTCTVQGTSYVTITGNRVTLSAAANALTVSTTQTIACGSKTVNITIVPAATDGVQVQKLPSTTDANGNLVINAKLVRPASSIVGKTNTTVWVAARIPKDNFFFTDDEWFFYTPSGWQVLMLPNPHSVAYKTNPVNTETTFSIPTGLTASDLGQFNVEIHFGYADDAGEFQNKGTVWTK